jgi:hypothetical protein
MFLQALREGLQVVRSPAGRPCRNLQARTPPRKVAAGQHGIEHAPHRRLAQARDLRVDVGAAFQDEGLLGRVDVGRRDRDGTIPLVAADAVRRAAEIRQVAVDRGVQRVENGLERLCGGGLLAGDLNIDSDGAESVAAVQVLDEPGGAGGLARLAAGVAREVPSVVDQVEDRQEPTLGREHVVLARNAGAGRVERAVHERGSYRAKRGPRARAGGIERWKHQARRSRPARPSQGSALRR